MAKNLTKDSLASEKEVMRFFNDMDAAALVDTHKSVSLNNRVLRAQEFLQDICMEHYPDRYNAFREEKILKRDSIGLSLVSIRVENELGEVFKDRAIKR